MYLPNNNNNTNNKKSVATWAFTFSISKLNERKSKLQDHVIKRPSDFTGGSSLRYITTLTNMVTVIL